MRLGASRSRSRWRYAYCTVTGKPYSFKFIFQVMLFIKMLHMYITILYCMSTIQVTSTSIFISLQWRMMNLKCVSIQVKLRTWNNNDYYSRFKFHFNIFHTNFFLIRIGNRDVPVPPGRHHGCTPTRSQAQASSTSSSMRSTSHGLWVRLSLVRELKWFTQAALECTTVTRDSTRQEPRVGPAMPVTKPEAAVKSPIP